MSITAESPPVVPPLLFKDPVGFGVSAVPSMKSGSLGIKYLENNPQGTPAPTESEKPVNTTFDDVDPDAWYADAVAAVVEAGLLKGKDDGLFHPDDIITVAI